MIKILFLAANGRRTPTGSGWMRRAREIKERIQLSNFRDQFVLPKQRVMRRVRGATDL